MRYLLTLVMLSLLPLWAGAADNNPMLEHINRHILAYNANNAEAYADFFHPDIEVYNYPQSVLTSGRSALIQSTQRTFSEHSPGTILLNSMLLKDKVVTLERASFTLAGVRRNTELVKIYQFQDGLIRRMTFMD